MWEGKLEEVYSFCSGVRISSSKRVPSPSRDVDPLWSLKCCLEGAFPEGGGRATRPSLTFQKGKRLQAAELHIPAGKESRICC